MQEGERSHEYRRVSGEMEKPAGGAPAVEKGQSSSSRETEKSYDHRLDNSPVCWVAEAEDSHSSSY